MLESPRGTATTVLAGVVTDLDLTELQAAAKNHESRLSISDAIAMNRMLSSRKHTPHRTFFGKRSIDNAHPYRVRVCGVTIEQQRLRQQRVLGSTTIVGQRLRLH